MGPNPDQAREAHFARLQKTLEEGLQAIASARTPDEADAARQWARTRLDELNLSWQEAFPREQFS